MYADYQKKGSTYISIRLWCLTQHYFSYSVAVSSKGKKSTIPQVC